MQLPRFEHLVFGELDAAEEARRYPHLLVDGFYDHRDAVQQLEAGDAFLLLGLKGAGKSAVFEHLRLKYDSSSQLHFDYWDLSNFPIADVRNMKTGPTAGLGRTQNAWELLLLLRLVERLNEDGSSHNGSAAFGHMVKDLQAAGLVSNDGWKTQVIEWSKATAKLSLPFAAEVGLEVGKKSIQLFQLAEAIRRVLQQTSVVRRHMLALDGLDLLYFESENKRQSVSGLVQAVRALNLWAMEPGDIPVSFVCCLRSDMFNTLGSSETSKYSGKSVTLDWAREGMESEELWALFEGKIGVKHSGIDIRKDYLSGIVSTGDTQKMAHTFILEHTRMFPRDMVAALKFIQRAARASRLTDSYAPLPGPVVKAGIEMYCNEYFEAELASNLAGSLSENNQSYSKTDMFVNFLKNLTRNSFTFEEVRSALESGLDGIEIQMLLKQAFDVSAIGKRDKKTGKVTFVYRRPGGAAFDIRSELLLHNALVRAWSINRY